VGDVEDARSFDGVFQGAVGPAEASRAKAGPRRRHRPPAELVDLGRGVGVAVVRPPVVAAARVLGRGKSIDRAIAKSIDMAA